MSAIQASRENEKKRRVAEKLEWENVCKVFVLNDAKIKGAMDLVQQLPLAMLPTGCNYNVVGMQLSPLSFRKSLCGLRQGCTVAC